MVQSKIFFNIWRASLAGVVLFAGLTCNIAMAEEVKEEPYKPVPTYPEEVVSKQSGNIYVKFRASASDARIQEIADYYGAIKVSNLTNSDAGEHKDEEQWRKLRFENVPDLKNIARRIFHDTRVEEVEKLD